MKRLDTESALTLFSHRSFDSGDSHIRQVVHTTLQDVKKRGDEALLELTERFDGVRLPQFPVPQSMIEEARYTVPRDLQEAIKHAISRVRRFYEHQPKEGFIHQENGALLGQIVRPLERVACYIPGGTAPLFSTMIMTAVPAQVAEVPDIVVVTPPRIDGTVAPEILITADLLGINTIYRLGGAQAVAALAYGTASIPKADKIVGPGNAYVVTAKQLVYGDVGIEALPGPTETLVLADEHANIRHVAADLLAQAEHLDAQPVLVTTSDTLLDALDAELTHQLKNLSTHKAAHDSLEARGYMVKVRSLAEGITVANAYAPEHLCLLVRDPWALVPLVKHAGGIFVGEHSMEALGDYLAGPSHVMPTSSTARFSSAVNVRDFQKVIPLVSLSCETVEAIGPAGARMARAEGLEAHARAIESRLKLERS